MIFESVLHVFTLGIRERRCYLQWTRDAMRYKHGCKQNTWSYTLCKVLLIEKIQNI